MVVILPPYKVVTPVYQPGKKISVAPIAHYLWLEDYEYYDQLGRDPMQERKIWLIEDEAERMSKLEELVEEYPKQRHRRQMLVTAIRRGDECFVRHLVKTGLIIQPPIEEAKKQQDDYDRAQLQNGWEPPDELPDIADPRVAPLHSAAHNGQEGCLKIMIESRVDVDARDDIGRTPLHAAAANGQSHIIRYLLMQGADIQARTDSGDEAEGFLGLYAGADAFEMAAGEGNIEILRMLVEHQTEQKRTGACIRSSLVTPLAIQLAAGSRNVDAMRLLFEQGGYPLEPEAGKRISESLNRGQLIAIDDALPKALCSGDGATLRLLLSYKYHGDGVGDIGSFEVTGDLRESFVYAAYDAVMHDDLDKFEFVYQFGIREHDTMTASPLPDGQHLDIQHLFEDAAETSSMNCMKQLIAKYGAEPDTHRIPCGVKPLYLAAALNQQEAVRYLLDQCNVDIHAGSGRFATGPTALRIAVWLQSLDCVKILLEHGGPIDYIDPGLRDLTQPIKAILRCVYEDERPKLYLESENGAGEHIEVAKHDLEDRMPRYVRVELGASDQALIDSLQIRRRAERLREHGPNGRELGEEEAERLEDMEGGDSRRLMTPLPTYLDRESIVKTDIDLLPEFKPFAVAA